MSSSPWSYSTKGAEACGDSAVVGYDGEDQRDQLVKVKRFPKLSSQPSR
jgi:hypothetical protein